MVPLASTHSSAAYPSPLGATRKICGALELVKYAAPSGPIQTSLRKTLSPGTRSAASSSPDRLYTHRSGRPVPWPLGPPAMNTLPSRSTVMPRAVKRPSVPSPASHSSVTEDRAVPRWISPPVTSLT